MRDYRARGRRGWVPIAEVPTWGIEKMLRKIASGKHRPSSPEVGTQDREAFRERLLLELHIRSMGLSTNMGKL